MVIMLHSLLEVHITLNKEVFGIGIEKRFGDCEYKELWSDIEDAVAPSKISHNGWKAYITFRF